eukprot:2829116-Pleurochrysis_carterae.AAC.1
MYHVASSSVSAGKAGTDAEGTDAAAVGTASAGAVCDCKRVCRVVACRLAGVVDPCVVKKGFLGENK